MLMNEMKQTNIAVFRLALDYGQHFTGAGGVLGRVSALVTALVALGCDGSHGVGIVGGSVIVVTPGLNSAKAIRVT